MDILEGTSWVRWLHEIRKMEFRGAMALLPLGRGATGLELGSGDGFQLCLLRQRFDRVVAIDPAHRPASGNGFAFAVAEALPFPDGVFDLVVSNCVMEHLRDRKKALEEAVRVLRPAGYMVHVVPGVFWKLTALLFNPVGYPLRVAEKWWARRSVRKMPSDPDAHLAALPGPGILQSLRPWVCPLVHGTYGSHLAECRAYRQRHWRELFTHPRLALCAEAPLLSYTQFGFLRFHFLGFRRLLARWGAASSWVFVLQKVN